MVSGFGDEDGLTRVARADLGFAVYMYRGSFIVIRKMDRPLAEYKERLFIEMNRRSTEIRTVLRQ